jgi:predicted metal-dependent hydrolase
MRDDPLPYRVEIVKSARRRKTVAARLVADDLVRVMVPASMSAADQDRYVAELVARIDRQRRAQTVDLAPRAARLAARYGLPHPRSVRWVSNQEARWGSCSMATGDIRLSDRLGGYPAWVIDYVLVHELAHLRHGDHSPAFRRLVDRYPRAERARGFLIAKGMEPDA